MVTNRLRSLFDRAPSPLAWSGPAKVILINGFFLLPITLLSFRGRYLQAHPEVEPYIDRDVLALMTDLASVSVGFLLVWIGIGFLLVRWGRESRTFVQIANLFWWSALSFVTYLTGPSTSPIFILFPLLSFLTLLVFRSRDALPGIFTGILIVFVTTVGERLGVLPYAPYFATWPEEGGRIADDWVAATTAWTSFAVVTVLVAYTQILRQWRAQSARLAEMSEALKRMFGRYMSTEVMKTLLETPGALELGGARRRVTMLLTDLRGFTSLAERLSPEDVLALLNDYFEVMVDVCLRHQGTIAEITGDALLVTFGAPGEMQNHPARAVACAIEMQNAMSEVNSRNARSQRPELQMGIGLHTAEVVVGNIGSEKRSKFGVVGSAVNMTSRIESYSVGGQVLVSQAIVDELGDLLRIDDRNEHTAKGLSAPLVIYEVGGIGGPYGLALEKRDEALKPLRQSLVVRWELVSGKHGGDLRGESRVSRLSRTGIEIASAGALHALDDVRLNLVEGSAYVRRGDVYAKVVGQSDGVARMRFTAIPPEIVTYFEGLRA